MSDDGVTQNAKSVYPRRSLFQVCNPFWPPVDYERLPSSDTFSQALQKEDVRGICHSESDSVTVNIPVSDSSREINSKALKHIVNSKSSIASEDQEISSSSESQDTFFHGDESDSTSVNSVLYTDSSYESTESSESTDSSEPDVICTDDLFDNKRRDSSCSRISCDRSASQRFYLHDRSVEDERLHCSDTDYEHYEFVVDKNINAEQSSEEQLPVKEEDSKRRKNSRGGRKDKSERSSKKKSKERKESKEEGGGDVKDGEREQSKESHHHKSRRKHSGKRKSHSRDRKSHSHKSRKSKKHKKDWQDVHDFMKTKKKKRKGKDHGSPDDILRASSYPTSVYFILATEFCERFAYFGLRSMLVLYLTGWLGFTQNKAASVFHLFSFAAYFSPLIGGSMAEGCLGRYTTILCMSGVYALGCIIMAITALPPPEIYGPIAGLLLISLGTGGIKPWVFTFGSDQLSQSKLEDRDSFFSSFYFVINIGSLLSALVLPVLKSDVHCVNDTCYPLAFGVPAIMMCLALLLFCAGRGMYEQTKPEGNSVNKTVMCICHAMGSSHKPKKKKKNPHWLDAAGDLFDKEFIEDVKVVTKLIWLFLPLPVFWALFNQLGSRWILQAAQLDGTLGSLGHIKPDQMLVFNPLFLVLLIPVFDKLIYPCIISCGAHTRPLQRMVVGMVMTSAAFVLAAVLQMNIDRSGEPPVEPGQSGFTILNTVDCRVNVRGTPVPFFEGSIGPYRQTQFDTVKSGSKQLWVSCATTGLQAYAPLNLTDGNASRLVITAQPTKLDVFELSDMREKSSNGTARVSFLHLLAWVGDTQIRVSPSQQSVEPVIIQINKTLNTSAYHIFEPGSYQVAFPSSPNSSQLKMGPSDWKNIGKPFEVGSGGVYTVALIAPRAAIDLNDVVVESFVDVKENTLSMLLMIPQYFAITVGEILFSISGLAFAYTQAPESMRSMVQVCWLLTTSLGDLIVVTVVEANMMPNQADEFFLFAGLMLADSLLFAAMSCFYTYVTPRKSRSKKHKKSGEERGKHKKSKRHKKGKRHHSKSRKHGEKKKRKHDKKKDRKKEGSGDETEDSSEKESRHHSSQHRDRSKRKKKSKGGDDGESGKHHGKHRKKSKGGDDGESGKHRSKHRRKSKGDDDEESRKHHRKHRKKSKGGDDEEPESETSS